MKRKIWVRLAAVMTAAALAGCGKSGGTGATDNGEAADGGADDAGDASAGDAQSGGTDKVEQTNRSLALSLSESQAEEFENVIEKYRELYPDVDLQVETYSDGMLVSQASKLETEVMSGEGPDVLFMQCYGGNDIYKMMKAGIFADMNEYVEADETWNDGADYVKSALDAGVFDGSRYIMPLTFNGMGLIASQEGLDAAGIKVEDCKDTLSTMQRLASIYEQGCQKRVLGAAAQFTLFPEMLDGGFLDYAGEKVNVDADRLRQASECYARMYEEEMSDTYGSKGYYGIGYDIAHQDAYAFLGVSVKSALSVAGAIASEATPVCIPMRSGDGRVLANLSSCVGRRANSPNKQNAYNMIRLMMGEEAQESIQNTFCPVNKAALEKMVDEVVEGNQEMQDAETPVGELDDGFLEAYKKSLTESECCFIPTSTCKGIFYEYMNDYFSGEADYDSCIKEFEDYIQIYLTE